MRAQSKPGIVRILAGTLLAFGAHAADPEAGRQAAAPCAQCHAPRDWEGETQAALASLIRDVVARRVSHPLPVSLTEDEIASIAAYWAASGR